jgi:hypothetical protein
MHANIRRSFALDQAELDAGFVLSCQSLLVAEELTVASTPQRDRAVLRIYHVLLRPHA